MDVEYFEPEDHPTRMAPHDIKNHIRLFLYMIVTDDDSKMIFYIYKYALR